MENYRQQLEKELKTNPFANLVDIIHTILLHDIVSYKYQDGDHIKEAVLAEEFGVSRTPIRAVIDRLVKQGFIVKEKNSVAVVKAFSPQEKEDLISARFALEPKAMAYAAERITEDEIRVLEDYMRILSAACLARDMVSAFEYENIFHDYVILCSHNEFIIKQYEVVKHYFHQSRVFFTANNGFYEYFIQEHQLLIAVLKLRDPDLASAAMKRHLSVLRTEKDKDGRIDPRAFGAALRQLSSKAVRSTGPAQDKKKGEKN